MALTLETVSHEAVRETFPDLVPRYNADFPGRNITLFGSFSPDNWERIKATRATFSRLGFHVLAPLGEEFVDSADGFAVLDADIEKLESMQRTLGRSLSPQEVAVYLELLFQKAMDISDICYLVLDERGHIDDGGYLGMAASVEMGRQTANEVPIVASTKISPTLDERDGYDSMFWAYASMPAVASPQEVADLLNGGGSYISRYGVTRPAMA